MAPMAQLVAEPPAGPAGPAPVAPHQQLYSLTRSSAWQEVLQMWCRFQNRAVETMLAFIMGGTNNPNRYRKMMYHQFSIARMLGMLLFYPFLGAKYYM